MNTLAVAYSSATRAITRHSPIFLMTGRTIKIPLDLFSDEIQVDIALNEAQYVEQIQAKLKQAFKLVTSSRELAVNKAKI